MNILKICCNNFLYLLLTQILSAYENCTTSLEIILYRIDSS